MYPSDKEENEERTPTHCTWRLTKEEFIASVEAAKTKKLRDEEEVL